MADFSGTDLRDSRFDHVDLRGATVRESDLRGVRFSGVALSGAVLRGVEMADVEITGELAGVRVNGVDIGPLVEAELDRRMPQRVLMRPADAEGFRLAWRTLAGLWDQTLARARGLDPELLHACVDGEWSFSQTLRHLAFATDAWVSRAVLGDPVPWHPLELPWDGFPDTPGVPRDLAARPPLAEVLALRDSRRAVVDRVLADLTDDALAATTTPVDAPGWPPPESFPVRECLLVVLNEEWEHRLIAERDLAVLAGRAQVG